MSVRLIPNDSPEPIVVSGLLRGCDDEMRVDVPRAMLSRLMDFCAHHAHRPMAEIARPVHRNLAMSVQDPWDVAFLPATWSECYQLLHYAVYMDIPSLQKLVHAKMASMLLLGEPSLRYADALAALNHTMGPSIHAAAQQRGPRFDEPPPKPKRVKPGQLTGAEIRLRIMDCFRRPIVDLKTGLPRKWRGQRELRILTRMPLHCLCKEVMKLCDFEDLGAHDKRYTLKKLYQ